MADDEFRVQVELGAPHSTAEHRLGFWERLRTLDIDDDARERLGSRVTVTRDGEWITLYAATLADAQEAQRTVAALVAGDDAHAQYWLTRWDSAAQEWVDPAGGEPVTSDEPDAPTPDPSYVILEAYKPEFLRDLGL